MDTTLMAAIALPALTLITYWIVIYFRRRKNDPMQHHGSKESHQKVANGSEVGTNVFAQKQHQHQQHQHQQHQHQQHQQHQHQQQQQRNQKGGGTPAATANKARHNNNANHNVTSSGNNNKRYDKEQTFNHPWLASTLKGHTKDIRDLDFSSNGKFLASCAEDNLIRRHNSGHRDSTTSDLAASDDINSSSSNEDLSAFQQKSNKKSSKSRRNRRQRKNQMEIDDDIIKDNEKQPIMGAGVNNNGSCGIGGGKPHQRKQGKLNATITSASIATLVTANNKGSTTSLSSTSSIGSMSSSTSSTPSHTPFGSPIPRVNKFDKISRALAPPLRQHTKLNLQEHELVKYLRNYIVEQSLLRVYGYPMESTEFEGCAMIYKCLPATFTGNNGADKKYQTTKKTIINMYDGLNALTNKWYESKSYLSYDSGHGSGSGSGSSSPPSIDSDMSEGGEEETAFPALDGTPSHKFSRYHHSLQKHCVRCKSSFHVSDTGDYLSKESCVYHWGKLLQTFGNNRTFSYQYSCCKGESNSGGCTLNRLHVWSGVVVGTNGPYKGFYQTQPKHATDDSMTGHQKAYALDCEMCYTGLGLECTKITVISCDGQMVYEYFVRPQCEIVDYNTRFSGITEKDLSSRNSNVKTLAEVQRDLLQLFNADTILIGHALENDLRALRLIHHNIIDTSISFPHASGFPYRRALKTLAKVYLNREIQTSDAGHSSFEDSRACLELMLWKIRKEYRLVLEQ